MSIAHEVHRCRMFKWVSVVALLLQRLLSALYESGFSCIDFVVSLVVALVFALSDLPICQSSVCDAAATFWHSCFSLQLYE